MQALEVIKHLRVPPLHPQPHAPLDWRSRIAGALSIARRVAAAAADWSSLALFQALRTFHALRELIAAFRNRVPSTSEVAASTMLAYAAVGIMAAILANDLLRAPSAGSSTISAGERRPDWIEIAHPHGAFALEAPVLEGIEANYQVRRHRLGGGRKDELTFGGAELPGPYVRLSLYRPGAEDVAEPDALEAVTALAAESGIDADLQETSGKVRTKFGDLPAVNMRVRVRDGWRNCLAVSGAWSGPRFGLVAWWCNPGPEMVALGEFACLLDRTALMSAGGDDQLAEFFARAELRRNYCNVQSSFVSPTPRLGYDWIDAKRRPQLRGRIAGR